jgi:uncharacterized small protein (DUF1192 family)
MLTNPFEKNSKKAIHSKIGQHLKVISIEEIECFFSEKKERICILLTIGIIY